MPRFNVMYKMEITYYVIVEADDIEKARDMVTLGNFDYSDSEPLNDKLLAIEDIYEVV